MLINFLDPCFEPKIETRAVSDDTHHFNNLIADDFRTRNLGFMAYSVSKPPITLIFKLKWKIQIDTLKIWTQLGSLKTTKVEIKVRSGEKLIQVGEVGLKDEIGIVFSNKPQSEPNFKTATFYRSSYFTLQNTSEIHVVLKETLKCPPVVKKIEIWGKPGKSLSNEEISEINCVWNRKFAKTTTNASKSSEICENLNEDTIESFEIPEEYLDQITYEIMVLPMALPSGKVVDQSTVDKYNVCEAQQGRPPSDPFTGLDYTDKRFPRLDPALKSRIDQFMMLHSHELEIKKSGRTTGRKRKFEEIREKVEAPYNPSSLTRSKPSLSKESTQFLSPPSSSLDSLIKNALKNITRFTQQTAKKTDDLVCAKCSKDSNYLYKIVSCKHLICRNCLTSMDNLVCSICQAKFSRTDVQKFHK